MKSGEQNREIKLTDQPLFRIGVLVAIILVAFLGLQQLFIPKSFGELGHFRGDNIQEWADQTPAFAPESDTCLTCHNNQKANFADSSHQGLSCESCHGPANEHVSGPMNYKPAVEVTREFCGSCHQSLAARPDAVIKQVDLETHMPSVNCSQCHDPHNPWGKFGGVK